MNPIDMIPLCTGDPHFVAKWAEGCRKAQTEQDAWIAKLRAEGVSAAHPDDGWVNREENKIHFAYPQFNAGVKTGDIIALGWPGQYRLVKVTKVEQSRFFPELIYYHFQNHAKGGA